MTRKQPRNTKYERRQKHDEAIDLDRHRVNSTGAFHTRHLSPHLDAHPEQWNEHGEENPRDADEHYAEHGPCRQSSHVSSSKAFAPSSLGVDPTGGKRRRSTETHIALEQARRPKGEQ